MLGVVSNCVYRCYYFIIEVRTIVSCDTAAHYAEVEKIKFHGIIINLFTLKCRRKERVCNNF